MGEGEQNCYAILGVAPDASIDTIKAAYRALAKQYHPDLRGAGQADATRQFIELQEAYKVLSDPLARSGYDSSHAENQAQEFDASADDENTAQIDPEEVWRRVAIDHPEIDGIHAHLQRVSLSLANRFRIEIIDGDYGEDPALFARDLEKAFFEKYFGPSPEIIDFAMRLLMSGHRDAARRLSRAVRSDRLKTDRRRAFYIARMKRQYFPDDAPQAPQARRDKRTDLARHGRTGRNLAIAACLALFLLSVTGAAVYDRASGGTIAAAIMAPFAGRSDSQTLAEVPKVIVKPEETIPIVAVKAETTPVSEPAHAVGQPAATVEEQAPATGGDIKPIVTAKLEVADATGSADSPFDLDLKAIPGQAGQDLELRLSGVPEDAYLTAGTKISPASWSLKPAEAAIVKLVVPAKSEFDLSVAAVEAKTGELVAPIQEINVKVDSPLTQPEPVVVAPPEPAAAEVLVEEQPAPAQEATTKQVSEQARTLISRGDYLMSLGDLAAAREFYMEALKLGATPTTLLQIGMTYDPVIYAATSIAGLSPDASMALEYYRQADRAGVAGAREAIVRLEAWKTRDVASETPDLTPQGWVRLDVADVARASNNQVDLAIKVIPAEVGHDLEIRLWGMPFGAFLTAGTKLSSTVGWSLKPTEATNVKLVLPKNQADDFNLAVAAVEAKTGELVGPIQTISVKVNPLADSRRIALVIGNSVYQHNTILANPSNDAVAMAEALEKLGFEVILGVNQTKSQMEDAIQQFASKVERAETVLLFYAGHAIQRNEQNYLIPIDADIADDVAIRFKTIELGIVTNLMVSDKRAAIALLDACRDNPLARNLRLASATRSTARDMGLAEVKEGGLLIGYATGPGKVAEDGTGTHSPWTEALLRHIGTEGIEVNTMLTRVRVEVNAATQGLQIPWTNSSMLGEFYFVPQQSGDGQVPVIAAPEQPAKVNPEPSSEATGTELAPASEIEPPKAKTKSKTKTATTKPKKWESGKKN